MALAYSDAVNKARLDAIEATISPAAAAAFVNVYKGTQPAMATAHSAADLLAVLVLPADWMAAATGAAPAVIKAKQGSWQTAAPGAVLAGTATYFRIVAANGTTQGIQGLIPTDMTLDNTSIAVGQQVSVSTFTLTAGNQASP